MFSSQITINCSTAQQDLWGTNSSPMNARIEYRTQIRISDFRNEWLLLMLYSSNSSLTAIATGLEGQTECEQNRDCLYLFKVRNYANFTLSYHATEAKSIHSKCIISTVSLTNFTVVVKVFHAQINNAITKSAANFSMNFQLAGKRVVWENFSRLGWEILPSSDAWITK